MLLLLPPKCWDYGSAFLSLFCTVLRTEPRASYMLSKHSTNRAMSPSLSDDKINTPLFSRDFLIPLWFSRESACVHDLYVISPKCRHVSEGNSYPRSSWAWASGPLMFSEHWETRSRTSSHSIGDSDVGHMFQHGNDSRIRAEPALCLTVSTWP